jgi:hypothetical protein
MRAIMFSSYIDLEDASRRVVDQGHGIILPAKTPDNIGPKSVHVALSKTSAPRPIFRAEEVIHRETA